MLDMIRTSPDLLSEREVACLPSGALPVLSLSCLLPPVARSATRFAGMCYDDWINHHTADSVKANGECCVGRRPRPVGSTFCTRMRYVHDAKPAFVSSALDLETCALHAQRRLEAHETTTLLFRVAIVLNSVTFTLIVCDMICPEFRIMSARGHTSWDTLPSGYS